MRQLRYNVAISLDGFIAPPDGSVSWIVGDPDIDFPALYASFDAFVLGRKTYEFMRTVAPNPLADVARDRLVVVSRTMVPREHPEVTVVREDVVGFLKGMKEREGRDIWLFGGGELAGPCFDAGLVDMVETAIMPVLLRNGQKMVMAGSGNVRLELESVKRMEKSGILMCKYKVLRESVGD